MLPPFPKMSIESCAKKAVGKVLQSASCGGWALRKDVGEVKKGMTIDSMRVLKSVRSEG